MSDDTKVRVAIDLSGPHEPLGNWMVLLADALEKFDHCHVVRFQSGRENRELNTVSLSLRAWRRSRWQRSRGRSIDRLLPSVDAIHVAGVATPPTEVTPLVISVDDLRPLRDDSRGRQRVAQLRRAVQHGAQLVASSRTASLEVQRTLGLARENVVVVPPAVSWDRDVANGRHLVVNLTGKTEEFLQLAPSFVALAQRRDARVIVLASHAATARIRQRSLDVTVRDRRDATDVLADARAVLHLSDGARFPSFVVAALAAGVPTCATSTPVNRELLDGATTLVDETDELKVIEALEDLWENESLRAIRRAAGRARAGDYAPAVAAHSFAGLYGALDRRQART
jgi:hypothetical protein